MTTLMWRCTVRLVSSQTTVLSTAPSGTMMTLFLELQNDLNKIAEWEFMWQMQFNIDKCFVLRVGRPKHKLLHLYTLHNQNLSETDFAKYLGVTITSDLQWNQHINNITNKANSILGLLRRNLRIPSQTIKTRAYQSLVRPHLEYASGQFRGDGRTVRTLVYGVYKICCITRSYRWVIQ